MASEVRNLATFFGEVGRLAKLLETACTQAAAPEIPAGPGAAPPAEPPPGPVVGSVVGSVVGPVVGPVVEPPVVAPPVVAPPVVEPPVVVAPAAPRRRRDRSSAGAPADRPKRLVITDEMRRGIIEARLRVPPPLLAEVAHQFGISTGSVCNVMARWRIERVQCTTRNPTLPGQQDLPFEEPAAT